MIRIYKKISKNSRLKIVLILVAVLSLSLFLTISLGWAKQRKSKAQWTFMVYLDADNNLDYFGYQNVHLMETVGSTDDMNIIALWDKYDDVANLYKINPGESEIVQGFPLNGVETNMGDPDTLQTFVTYSMRHFRANNYILVLWDHGDDFRGCCWDDHPYDYLSHQEIIQALSGCSLDILAFDACVEGMIEVAYEYAWAPRGPEIDYIVATEGYVPGWGYPYDTILSALAEEPEISPFEYSKVMVDDYITYYENLRPASKLVELASIDLTYMIPIVQQLGDLTDVLEGLLAKDDDKNDAYHEMIAEARGEGNLGWSEYGWEAYIDLPTFIKSLYLSEGIPEAATLNSTLMEALYVKATEPMQSAEGL
ncbi:MAG: clostripain-related cysteine peptidase, partial [Candidatus Hermodarchaeota archaeon]